jgi:hypothetical protein
MQRDLARVIGDAAREQGRTMVNAIVTSVTPVVASAVAASMQQELAAAAGAAVCWWGGGTAVVFVSKLRWDTPSLALTCVAEPPSHLPHMQPLVAAWRPRWRAHSPAAWLVRCMKP